MAGDTLRTNGEKRKGRWMRRMLFRSVLVILLVSVAVFFIIRIVPGDPAVMILGEHATPEEIARIHEKLNLDLPVFQQFGAFLRSILLHGDTGESIKYGLSCRKLILKYVPVTLTLVFLSMLISITVSVILAFFAAVHRDSFFDHLIRILPAFTHGMPVFWVGLMFILFFSVRLRWFPVGGVKEGFCGMLHSLTLPAVTVAFGQIPSLVRSLREQILEVLDSDFVLTLKAARVPRNVIFRHVLRNAMIPTLMLLGVNISYLIGGTLVVEQVFAVKGIGKLLFEAISNRDFPLVQGIALYCSVFVVITGVVVELIAHRVDPRTER
ncbi:MAG: ABC transporter permease [Enterocloster sp.]